MKSALRTVCLASMLCAAGSANAAMTEFFFTQSYSGSAPAGAAPYIAATFSDNPTPGSVRLTLTSNGLTGIENVSRIFFNLNPLINASALSFTYVSGLIANQVGSDNDAFRVQGSGNYDVLFRYGANRGFNSNLNSVYDILGTGLTSQSFSFLSNTNPNSTPFFAAARINNISGGTTSGMVAVSAVPLPAAAWLFISGLAGLVGFARRRRSITA